eukprot:TRINITY_DN398_c0_g2_i20.p1 TRINITY_DN398_c0_g2~~TRINITY_DN398_c0_g2_i20.p1  ORF type:complete len:215 (+),score=33.59 TRINITY_DN398_c0_g2_i20:75-647(+)
MCIRDRSTWGIHESVINGYMKGNDISKLDNYLMMNPQLMMGPLNPSGQVQDYVNYSFRPKISKNRGGGGGNYKGGGQTNTGYGKNEESKNKYGDNFKGTEYNNSGGGGNMPDGHHKKKNYQDKSTTPRGGAGIFYKASYPEEKKQSYIKEQAFQRSPNEKGHSINITQSSSRQQEKQNKEGTINKRNKKL